MGKWGFCLIVIWAGIFGYGAMGGSVEREVPTVSSAAYAKTHK